MITDTLCPPTPLFPSPFLLTFPPAAAAAHHAQLLHVSRRYTLSRGHEMCHAFIVHKRPPKACCRRSSCSGSVAQRVAAAARPSPPHRWVSALHLPRMFPARFSEAAAVRYMSSDWDAHATAHLIKRGVLQHSSAVAAVILSLTPGAARARARICTQPSSFVVDVDFECGVW